MKKKLGHIFTLLLILTAAVSGCSLEEPLLSGEPVQDAVKVIGRPTPFNTLCVETRATKNDDESVIKNMAMFVFDSSGAKVDYQFIEESKPLFIIDRDSHPYSDYSNRNGLAGASIYILANIPSADRAVLAAVSTENGLPMFGKMPETVDLRKPSSAADDPLRGSVLEIPMTCLFAKIDLNFSVIPTQKSDFVQKFRMTSWTVENVPSKVRMRQPTGDSQYHAQSVSSMLSGTFSSVDRGTNPILEGGSTPLSFSLYVPEHRLTPARTAMTYPSGIDDEHKQMFKPEWLSDGENPIKVTVNGVYTDHRNIEKEVSYTLYPGLDNWKDFYVNRDCEYINDISIIGISNSKYGDAGSVSLDTRVDMSQNQYRFEIERETLLDSHWEIRPMRITLDPGQYPGSRIEIAVVDADGRSAAEGGSVPAWIRMEMPGGYASIQGNPAYCAVDSQTEWSGAIQKVAMKYDFYLTRGGVKEGLTVRDYSGYDFTKEIASNTNSGISILATNSQPQSAVEYCVNKNKRKSDGSIDYDNMTWYLPAIDEIEDICKGGYSEFEVFQDKYYWSSQPAYKIGKMDYVAKITSDEVVFNYYTDDIGLQEDPDNRIGRARATKINDSFENVKSEIEPPRTGRPLISSVATDTFTSRG